MYIIFDYINKNRLHDAAIYSMPILIKQIDVSNQMQMIQRSQYEQMLIRLDYMNSACDQLLSKIYSSDGKMIVRVYNKSSRRMGDQDNDQNLNKFMKKQVQQKQQYQREKQHLINKTTALEYQITRHTQIYKHLTKQITQQKKTYIKSQHLSHQKLSTNKLFRQLTSLQRQLTQCRKLLNTQLKSLNTIQQSKLQINEGLQKLQKRQQQLKTKIQKLIKQQKDYNRCLRMQQQYESLLRTKRKLITRQQHKNEQTHLQINKKLQAISQSKQNIQQMTHYNQQLSFLIMQQNFIIDQIQSRQNQKNKQKDQLITNDNDQDDSKIFQLEIVMLKKTIANRRFLYKKKKQAVKKLEELVEYNFTPKNISILQNDNDGQQRKNKNVRKIKNKNDIADSEQKGKQSKRNQINLQQKQRNYPNLNKNKNNNYESIFKIQIQPISHSSPININKNKLSSTNKNNQQQNYNNKHRNSMPSKLSKIFKPQRQRSHVSKSDNKINDLSTIQIQALQRILKDKQEYISKLMITQKKKQNKLPNKQTFKISSTQKITNDIVEIGPNSRFIQKLIQSKISNNQQQKMNTTSNNVRIRTKKSQSQKFNKLNQIKKRVNFSLQQGSRSTVKPQTKSLLIDNNTCSKEQGIKNNGSIHFIEQNKTKKNNLSDQIEQKKQQQQTRQIKIDKFSSLTKNNKNKYKDKLFQLQHQKTSIDNVFKKIQQIKRSQQKILNNNNSKENNKNRQKVDSKIKIYKLSSSRKYGNSLSFQRKGMAQGVQLEQSQSQQQQQKLQKKQLKKQQQQQLKQLQKIQQQQQSIRNTLQSIVKENNIQ